VALMHAEAFTCAVDIRFMAIAVPPKGAADGIGDRLPLGAPGTDTALPVRRK
jgi:hypothetical protein